MNNTAMSAQEINIVLRLLEYKKKYEDAPGNAFSNDSEAERLIQKDWNAFLFAVIFDQQIRAGEAWSKPAELKRRLGSLDVHMIAAMNDADIVKVFEQRPALHRYVKKMALWIKSAARRLVKDYSGNAENIWRDTKNAQEIIDRFDAFDGVGQKKSTMATNFLADYFKIPITNWESIDISVDEMVRRVFKRLGLVSENATDEDIIHKARMLRPAFPGELDYPTWEIGSSWCSLENPYCYYQEEGLEDNCPLLECCQSADKLGRRPAPNA